MEGGPEEGVVSFLGEVEVQGVASLGEGDLEVGGLDQMGVEVPLEVVLASQVGVVPFQVEGALVEVPFLVGVVQEDHSLEEGAQGEEAFQMGAVVVEACPQEGEGALASVPRMWIWDWLNLC